MTERTDQADQTQQAAGGSAADQAAAPAEQQFDDIRDDNHTALADAEAFDANDRVTQEAALAHDIHETYEAARKKREEKIKRERELAKKKHEALLKKRQRHILISSVIMIVILSVVMVMYPTPIVSITSVMLILLFFCVGVTYQRAITQLLVIAAGIIMVTQSFYYIFS